MREARMGRRGLCRRWEDPQKQVSKMVLGGGYLTWGSWLRRQGSPIRQQPWSTCSVLFPWTQQPPPRAPSLPDAPSPPPAFSRRRLPQAVSTEEKESYRMSAIQNLHSFDPFADASKGDDLLPAGTEDYIHIRIQQRNGRKTLTTVQGIADDYDKKKLVKAFKKKFACNGTVIEHPEYGEVIQLQGDQRKNICQFLVEIGLAKDDQLKVHGF
uniref:Eukaryotic translation initiation factor 1 n=1 Tax=Canis lupus familiaris TaxID=9615 RepID=A0A8C0S6C6_CANLF